MDYEGLYLDIINNISEGVYYVDGQRTIQFWNKGAQLLTGYSADEMIGRACNETNLQHINSEGVTLCSQNCPLFKTLVDGELRNDTVMLRHKSGYRISINVNIYPIVNNEEVIGAIEIFTQNSSKVYTDDVVEELSEIALHDSLTGLPNKRYLESYLSYKLNEYEKFNKLFAVLFANIDDFSSLNNSYSHEVGDELLHNIAQSLKSSIGANDMVGRWSGGEFLGIYSIEKPGDALEIANKFKQMVFNTGVFHEEQYLNTSVSVGITAVQNLDNSVKDIISRANYLMYKSKQSGKNCVTTG